MIQFPRLWGDAGGGVNARTMSVVSSHLSLQKAPRCKGQAICVQDSSSTSLFHPGAPPSPPEAQRYERVLWQCMKKLAVHYPLVFDPYDDQQMEELARGFREADRSGGKAARDSDQLPPS